MIAGTAALAGLAWLLPSGRAPAPAGMQVASVELFNDAPGALFAGDQLTPGRAVTRCVTIAYTGAYGSGPVRMAADLTGALMPYLRLTVAVGTGGQAGDCAGFHGAEVYAGPLGGLATPDGVGTGWVTSTTPENRTFRLTIAVVDDNAAQGAGAGGTLRWLLRPVGDAPAPTTATPPAMEQPTASVPPRPAPPTGPTAAPPASARPAPPTGPTATPPASARPTTSTTASARPVPEAPPSRSPATPTRTRASVPPTAEAPATATPAGPGAAQPTASRLADRLSAPPSDDAAASAPPADQPSGGAGTDDAHGSGGWWRSATHALGTLAAGTARHAAIPLTGLLIMLIFLAVQDNIDRRDPKLALAPLYRERFLRFDGSPEDPGPAGTHHEEEL